MYINGKYAISNNDWILKPSSSIDLTKDNRILIPFMTPLHKMGMINRDGQVIIEPKYDIICNDVYIESDLIVVGELYPYGIIRKSGSVDSHVIYRYGVVDIRGNIVLELNYKHIFLGIDCDRITVQSFDYGYCVYDTKGNTVVPYGKYGYIDGFDKGLARVKQNMWGIINADGEEVLPLTYAVIWNFYKKNRLSTHVEKNRVGTSIMFHDLDSSIPYPIEHYLFNRNNNHNNFKENYGCTYGEFEGSYAQDVMGYSDDVINDAFEGDPDNYWNID